MNEKTKKAIRFFVCVCATLLVLFWARGCIFNATRSADNSVGIAKYESVVGDSQERIDSTSTALESVADSFGRVEHAINDSRERVEYIEQSASGISDSSCIIERESCSIERGIQTIEQILFDCED